jgi:hypothetical protein
LTFVLEPHVPASSPVVISLTPFASVYVAI